MCPTLKIYQIIIFSFGIFFLYLAYKGLRTGQVPIKGVYKGKRVALIEESPFVYWFNVIIYLLVGIAAIVFSIFLQLKMQ
jgi:hypothetical protein